MATLEQLPDDVQDGPTNFEIGSRVLGENDFVRVWEITLAPGERLPFHCHRTSYFWAVHTGTSIRATMPDGTYHDYEHQSGEVTWVEVAEGDPHVHDLANTGDRTLNVTVAELLRGDRLFWRPFPLNP